MAPWLLVVTYLALLALVALTTLLALLPLGGWGVAAALVIALAKAALIAAVYMEVARRGVLTRLAVGVGVFWLGILFVLTLSDVLTRGWIPSVGK